MKDLMIKLIAAKIEGEVSTVFDTLKDQPKVYCTITTPVGSFNFSNPDSWAFVGAGETAFIFFDKDDDDRYLIVLPFDALDRVQWAHCLKAVIEKGDVNVSVVTVLSNTGTEVSIQPFFKEAGEKVTLLRYQKDMAEIVPRH